MVTGLAWTAVGGEILFVETSLSKGKGGKLTLTGNLGDVMKESAMLAVEYLKAHSHMLDLPEDIFDNWNIHIHVRKEQSPRTDLLPESPWSLHWRRHSPSARSKPIWP